MKSDLSDTRDSVLVNYISQLRSCSIAISPKFFHKKNVFYDLNCRRGREGNFLALQ